MNCKRRASISFFSLTALLHSSGIHGCPLFLSFITRFGMNLLAVSSIRSVSSSAPSWLVLRRKLQSSSLKACRSPSQSASRKFQTSLGTLMISEVCAFVSHSTARWSEILPSVFTFETSGIEVRTKSSKCLSRVGSRTSYSMPAASQISCNSWRSLVFSRENFSQRL